MIKFKGNLDYCPLDVTSDLIKKVNNDYERKNQN